MTVRTSPRRAAPPSPGTPRCLAPRLRGRRSTANLQVTQQRAWGWDYLWPARRDHDRTARIRSCGRRRGSRVVVEDSAKTSRRRPISKACFGTNVFNDVQYLTPTGYQTQMASSNPRPGTSTPRPRCSEASATGAPSLTSPPTPTPRLGTSSTPPRSPETPKTQAFCRVVGEAPVS